MNYEGIFKAVRDHNWGELEERKGEILGIMRGILNYCEERDKGAEEAGMSTEEIMEWVRDKCEGRR